MLLMEQDKVSPDMDAGARVSRINVCGGGEAHTSSSSTSRANCQAGRDS